MAVTVMGGCRRLRALAAMGHPDEDVAGWLGVDVDVLARWQAGEDDVCRQVTLLAVFDRHASRPGRCRRTQERSRRAGWVTWLAWDDIDTDPEPAGVRPQPRSRFGSAGPPSLATVADYQALSPVSAADAGRDLVAAWREMGARVEEIAAALRLSERHVLNYCRELRAQGSTKGCA